MHFYRHYKNKPYKYLGTVAHSETLEDLVLYEVRYPNDRSKLWVRPKEMFFNSIELNGQSVPRFKKIPLELQETTQITEADIKNTIAPIMQKAMGSWNPESFSTILTNHRKFHLITAIVDDRPVGFKIGYELNYKEFYSWLGAVIPEYRGLGIASDMMECQHQWCRKEGYKKIQTKTQNRFHEMLLLNIKSGFNVVGTQEADEGGLKIILEKELI